MDDGDTLETPAVNVHVSPNQQKKKTKKNSITPFQSNLLDQLKKIKK